MCSYKDERNNKSMVQLTIGYFKHFKSRAYIDEWLLKDFFSYSSSFHVHYLAETKPQASAVEVGIFDHEHATIKPVKGKRKVQKLHQTKYYTDEVLSLKIFSHARDNNISS